VQRPPSATHSLVAAAGFAAFVATFAVTWLTRPFGIDVLLSSVAIIVVTTAVIFAVDIGWQKVNRRASTGLDYLHDDPSWSRTFIKIVGLVATISCVATGYWLFPAYHDKFFESYFTLLLWVLVPWIAAAIPYFHWVDRRMREPRDGYWQMGMLATLRWRSVDGRILSQHALAWIIKGFFMALMFSGMCLELKGLFLTDLLNLRGFNDYYGAAYKFIFFVDVGIAALGYTMSFRITDTHIRSSEPTLLGWVVALVCYEPFWSLIGRQYLAYDTGPSWDGWLWNYPRLTAIWGVGILTLGAIYVWSTVIFGARFSNLTHRGIITNGPYRWSKHPAYISKNLSWWMIWVPFLPNGSVGESVRHCLLLLGLNLIYVMRAKTEERHLSRDPVYVAYALWIEENGIFRVLRKMPLLRHFGFRAPVRGAVMP
jgi:protein-S-isoprenylcysteine O-methyltransferase Ste14